MLYVADWLGTLAKFVRKACSGAVEVAAWLLLLCGDELSSRRDPFRSHVSRAQSELEFIFAFAATQRLDQFGVCKSPSGSDSILHAFMAKQTFCGLTVVGSNMACSFEFSLNVEDSAHRLSRRPAVVVEPFACSCVFFCAVLRVGARWRVADCCCIYCLFGVTET